ncbi:MAG: IPT/TIG domain-containing protein [Methanoregula sp.]|uniref:IPT/TIG domain-containing protein n=1 Tax=Methanoregula sp. TaxID=2052170 RepID=UPI003BAE2B3C
MTAKSCYGLLLGLLLIVCVLLAGCSSQSTATKTATVPATPAGAKYSAGDIVTNNASSLIWLITSYDSTSDLYGRVLVEKNSDGTWSQETGITTTDTRIDTEKLYPVLLTQVSVASVTYATPTVPTAVTTTPSGNGPIASTVSPTTGAIGTSVSLTITGSNFVNGATVRLIQPGLQPVTASGVSVTSTQITCSVNLAGLNAGPANIQVINPDGQSMSLMSAFTIGLASPTISSITPTSGNPGSSYTLTLNGQTFTNAQLVNLVSSDGLTQIPCTNPAVSGSTSISCTLAIPDSATPGVYNVQVITSDGTTGSLTSSFTINNATS